MHSSDRKGDDNPDGDEQDERISRLPMGPLDEQRIEPTIDASINANDVLCGRGKISFNHGAFVLISFARFRFTERLAVVFSSRAPLESHNHSTFSSHATCTFCTYLLYLHAKVGNKRFRDAVLNALDGFMKAETRFEKSLVVHDVVEKINAIGGRFLKKDFRGGRWCELSLRQSREKVGHAIRDAANLYESRKKKEKKGPGISGDGTAPGSGPKLKPPPLYAKLHEHSDSSVSAASTVKRGSSLSSYQRKRKRTSSPLHFPAERAPSAPVSVASLPHSLKRSNIAKQPQQHIHIGADPVGHVSSGMVASLPVVFNRFPIEQQQHSQSPHQQQQQHRDSSGRHRHASPAAEPLLHLQSQPQLQLRDIYSTLRPLPYGPLMLQEQYRPPPLPMGPYGAAAHVGRMPFHLNQNAPTIDVSDSALMRTPLASTTRHLEMLHEPPHRQQESSIHDPLYDPRDPVARMQLMQQQLLQELYFQRQQPQQPPEMPPLLDGRHDENDHFMAAIDAVLGPLPPDGEDQTIPYHVNPDPEYTLLEYQYHGQQRELHHRHEQQQHGDDAEPPSPPHQPPHSPPL